jgi:pantoate--beta-alanine ligase
MVVRARHELSEIVLSWRKRGLRIGVVPTMGALHRGHLALVERAQQSCDRVVVSIFVNPTQFGPREDFAAYPRDEAGDLRKLRNAGVDLAWIPTLDAMYATGFATEITVKDISEGLCGPFRPGHFAGVATVVAKLLLQTGADQAFFGEKDYQQLQVIRRMAADLDIPVEIVGVDTVREPDGLALSSRNGYLSPRERTQATVLPAVLREIAAAASDGEPLAPLLEAGKARLLEAGFASIDYLAICDAESLREIEIIAAPARVFVAARLGNTRLIDNVPVPGADAARAVRPRG